MQRNILKNIIFLSSTTTLSAMTPWVGHAEAKIETPENLVITASAQASHLAPIATDSLQPNPKATNTTPHPPLTQTAMAFTSSATDPLETDGVQQPQEESSSDKNTIVVTGTLIRGIGASAGTKPIAITQEDIQRSGYATASQIMGTLPQNFISNYNEHRSRTAENNLNFSSSTAPDLRGLGAKATLVLINGRRLPAIGRDTTSLDISSIPASLIERIEVLPDGASSVYGADAVAGVVNIILKKTYDGAESRGRFGHTTEGGLRELNFSQSLGTTWNGGSVFAGYEFFHRTNLFHTERKYTRSDDLTPFGGTDRTTQYYGSPANILDPLTYRPDFAVPDNQSRQPLLPSDLLPGEQARSSNTGGGRDLMPRQRRHSVYLHARQELGQDLELFLEGRYGNRHVYGNEGYAFLLTQVTSDNPFYIDAYGDGRPLLVGYNFSRDLGMSSSRSEINSRNITAGLNYNLTESLQLRTHGSYSREKTSSKLNDRLNPDRIYEALRFTDPTKALNLLGNGDDNNPETLDYITEDYLFYTKFSISEFQSLLEGELFKLPAGDVRFALGGSYRKESAWADSTYSFYFEKQFSRKVLSAFSELYLPLVTEQNRSTLAESLTISISGRLDSYKDRPILPESQQSTRQTTFNPKIGASWEIFAGYRLRGTYGTSFATPSLDNRISTTSESSFPMDDPRSPTGRSFAMLLSGTAPDLRNEKATTWTVGATLTPPQIPGLRFDASFFHIKFKNRITENRVGNDVLFREDEYAPIILRNPTPEQVREICALVEAPSTLSGCANPEIVDVIIDTRVANHAQSIVKGVDFELGYTFSLGELGQLNLFANAAYLIDHKFHFTSSSPAVSKLNHLGEPVDFRSRVSATWLSGPISFTTFVNYVDDYRNQSSTLKPKIGSWTTVDVSLSYNFDQSNSNLLRGLVLNLSCINLFNNDPPFADTFFGFDGANATPIGRFVSISLSKKW